MPESEYKPRHARTNLKGEGDNQPGKKRRITQKRSDILRYRNLPKEEDRTIDKLLGNGNSGAVSVQENKKERIQESTAEIQQQKNTGNAKPDKSESMDSRKIIRRIGLAAVVFVLLFFLISLFLDRSRKDSQNSDDTTEQTAVPANPMPADLRKMWLDNRQISEDYVGQIVFDSGLADLAVVQAEDVYREDGTLYEFYSEDGERISDPVGHSGNDVYIWSDWKTHKFDGYGKDGAVFLDYRNTLNDQNLIIYGHHIARDFDPEGNSEFTPLDVFLDEKNYEENKTLKLILDNEIREYDVAMTFIIDAYNYEEIQILRTEFNRDLSGEDDPNFFDEYFAFAVAREKYPTGVEITSDDKFLTLITCIQHQLQYRQIVVCRETGQKEYDS